MQLNLPTPASALAIAAHPDDVEFGCGGTLAKWAADGCIVHHLICTDGSKGSWDPHEDTRALVAQRQDEQRAAAKALGASGEVVFLGYTDGELQSGLTEREQVARVIRELTPDVVFGHDPWRRYRLHPDHRHAGLLAVEGIVAARDPHFYPEQGVPHWRPSALLLWEADLVDHVEDVSAFVDAKLAALLEHRSQQRSTMHIDVGSDDESAQRDRFQRRVLDRLATFGRIAGVAHGEGFKRIDDL
ncbi:MAG TPA: PIG-L deacetylase family protein [Acidimicrobiales bacterium]|nr:PIG-L deacetylase family protein [Acidimicrobiales bacterium]